MLSKIRLKKSVSLLSLYCFKMRFLFDMLKYKRLLSSSLYLAIYFETFVLIWYLAITKTGLFKYTENFTTKKWKFSDKNFWYFFFIFLPKT